jgi:hypothetical protein
VKHSLEELLKLEAYYVRLYRECFKGKRLRLAKLWAERLELLRDSIERMREKQKCGSRSTGQTGAPGSTG